MPTDLAGAAAGRRGPGPADRGDRPQDRAQPVLAQHLLGLLADDGLLAYDAQAAAWRWSLERIAAHPGIDNVVDLLARRFEQLPGPAQSALQLLSCLGHRASGEALAIAMGLSPGAEALRSVEAALEPALQAGSLYREDDDWVFCHDRFREAAHASIPPEDRPPLHLRIARRQIAHPVTSTQVFAIAAQANLARSAVDAHQERRDFARLNLEAGRQAKAATAHHSALGFFRCALDFLGEDDTSDEGLAAHALCGEAEFMTGALEVAEARLSALERVAGDGVFGADLARLRAALYTTLGRFDLALGVGLAFLRKSGIYVPMQPDNAAVDREYAQLRAWLGRHGMDALRGLAIATDPLRRAITNIFADLIPPALYTDQNLVDLILLRMTNLGIVHGHTDASADGYACMTQVFGVRYGDYAAARDFGALALHLVDERGLARYRGRVYMTFGTMVVPWTQPARAARDYIRRAYKVLVETADHTFAIYCAPNQASGMFFAGEFLGDARDTVERGLAIARDANFQFVVDALLSQKLLLARLQDGTRGDPGAQPGRAAGGRRRPRWSTSNTWVYRLQGALLTASFPRRSRLVAAPRLARRRGAPSLKAANCRTTRARAAARCPRATRTSRPRCSATWTARHLGPGLPRRPRGPLRPGARRTGAGRRQSARSQRGYARAVSRSPARLHAGRGARGRTARAPSTNPERLAQPEELSPSELRVLRYLPTNLTRPEIARELYVSINTVNTHIRNIYSKLGARDRSSAVQRARELRLLSHGPLLSTAVLPAMHPLVNAFRLEIDEERDPGHDQHERNDPPCDERDLNERRGPVLTVGGHLLQSRGLLPRMTDEA